MLLDAEITYRSQADLTTLSQRLAKDVRSYAAGYAGKAVCFGYAYAKGAGYSACIKNFFTEGTVHIDNLAEFICN